MILFLLIFAILFYMEGLFRTRYFFILTMVAVLTSAMAIPFAQKLPLVVQRSLCFLPITVDPAVRANAQGSTDWRVDMWKEVIPTIPQYFFQGKGYVMDPGDMFLIQEAIKRGTLKSYEAALLAGDYHSGPLSLIIPFGIFGVIGFVWFWAASIKALYRNYLYGDPTLRTINRLLLAIFIARAIFYLAVFGSIHSDLAVFAGIIGLSVSLNHGVSRPGQQFQEDGRELNEVA